jgi:hypothetical protein
MTDTDSPTGNPAPKPRGVSLKASIRARAAKAKEEIQARCMAAGLKCEDAVRYDLKPVFKVGLRCGRDFRWVTLDKDDQIIKFSAIDFEKWVVLSDYKAICSYEKGLIEALVRFRSPSATDSMRQFRQAFAPEKKVPSPWDLSSIKILLEPSQDGPAIEISPVSEMFKNLTCDFSAWGGALSIKLSSCNVTMHDKARSLVSKLAGSMFFQIDLLSGIVLALAREPRLPLARRSKNRGNNLAGDLQYPRTEFDDAPSSLYWYGRSASGMPLLQFLAFYQVLEFYFPIYSKAEARRKLKSVLKDPTFRGDRDADISKLLSSIYISRSGAYGDERSQLRATLLECIDAEALRSFLESDSDRKDFFLAKGKSSPYQRLSLGNPTADLRTEVSDRLYEIRCRIVHTKSDAPADGPELLLPFSQEAEQLFFDIELIRYLAQRVLITASLPL